MFFRQQNLKIARALRCSKIEIEKFFKKKSENFRNFSSECGDSISFGGEDGGGDCVGKVNFGSDFETFFKFFDL